MTINTKHNSKVDLHLSYDDSYDVFNKGNVINVINGINEAHSYVNLNDETKTSNGRTNSLYIFSHVFSLFGKRTIYSMNGTN